MKDSEEKEIPTPVKKQLLLGTFCPIPFLQLQLNPLGDVSACCYSGEYKVGDVHRSTIEEIWNGEVMRRWRREFLTGEVKICQTPISTFQCQKNYQHLNHLIDFSEIQTRMPQRLDLRLNGKCNLECVMCDVWSQPNGMYDKSDFWQIGPEKIFPFLKEVDMLGGEPFIQKDTFRFIDEVVKVNATCTWGFITNCHYRLSPQLLATLEKLELRHIHMSLDAVRPETYAKVRLKGDLKKVMETVKGFIEFRNNRASRGKNFALFASFCVQRDNWFELPEFFDFCDQHNLEPIIQEVIGREQLSLQGLSSDEKAELKRLYTSKIRPERQSMVRSIISGLGQ